MNELISQNALPVPNAPITVRPATHDDLPWIDALHKKHSKQLGYATTKQFQEYLDLGGLLVAEQETMAQPIGYVMYRDRYLKRDELGVIYQLCVDPSAQRGLIGATLLKEVFERSAYGCRLFCCWCAQDLPANRFWEAMGFVPIAFRGGSTKKKRVHLFWQKKIVEGDTETRWWYPSKTEGGQMREDRLALPIPPGLHWSEPMPVIEVKEVPTPLKPAVPKKRVTTSKKQPVAEPPKPRMPMQFGPPPTAATPPTAPTDSGATASLPCPTPQQVPPLERFSGTEKKASRPKAPPIDPNLVRQARELRDRYLEHVNRPEHASLLESRAKYAVAKQLPAFDELPTMPRLAA
ncbi:MAG: GNAT family N-acetyltransferase [Planctomycetota bacterium]